MNILITGGASGLGESITKKLASNSNYKVFFTFNNSFEKARIIENTFDNTKGIKCNFFNEHDISNLCQIINQNEINVFINNAFNGKFLHNLFHKNDENEYLDDFVYNIMPIIRITKNIIVNFRSKKKGKILTILTSALSSQSPLGTSVYIANKSYLKALAKAWSLENIKYNITSNTISPAFMLTNFTSSFDERIIEQIRQSQPSGKILTTYEVAEIIYNLIDDTNKLNTTDIVILSKDNILNNAL
jgi:short-subunit dehydrogenase